MSVAVGKALHLGEHEYTTLKEAYDSTINGWNLYLYDHFGSLSADTIYSRIEYMALGLDIKIIFLDHLSILLSGLDAVALNAVPNPAGRFVKSDPSPINEVAVMTPAFPK